ncbi:hypothetical protein [Chitinimonas koreensis]|uniref:hypothetical protein n=1 Tax=Chitinimonas koreensis TaxID=356302 RepID=UPI0004225B6D|nr:hypothetical protein [Chitinimonas koreensis]QNM98248.1 hypothetical protein H9L41_08415 [Chitinimonas koreensis]
MTAALARQESLAAFLTPAPQRLYKRLPGPLPLGFPEAFRARLIALAGDADVSDTTFQRLYFDLILCPQLHAAMRRMHPGSAGAADQPASEAIFLDPAFSWRHHLDDRLNQRWRECLVRHGDGAWLDESLALLSSFRVLAEHLA